MSWKTPPDRWRSQHRPPARLGRMCSIRMLQGTGGAQPETPLRASPGTRVAASSTRGIGDTPMRYEIPGTNETGEVSHERGMFGEARAVALDSRLRFQE